MKKKDKDKKQETKKKKRNGLRACAFFFFFSSDKFLFGQGKDARAKVNNLRLLQLWDDFLDKGGMRGVLVDIVVSVLDAVELDNKGVGDAVLEVLDAVVCASDRGLDVWLLRGGMNAVGSKAEHLVRELEAGD